MQNRSGWKEFRKYKQVVPKAASLTYPICRFIRILPSRKLDIRMKYLEMLCSKRLNQKGGDSNE